MNTRLIPHLLLVLFAGGMLLSCRSSDAVQATNGSDMREGESAMSTVTEEPARERLRTAPGVDIDPSRPLVDHLRRFPSLIILDRSSGFDVRLRGNRSISQPDRVLFVINNTPVGQSYDQAASLITMENVERIEVLSSAFAQQRYGERGMFGAVVITTK